MSANQSDFAASMAPSTAMSAIVCNRREEVARFVADRIGVADLETFGAYQAIGVEQGGKIVTGFVLCDFNGVNAWVHLATDIPLTRYFLAVGFDYIFNKLGCQRLSGWVEASNQEALRLDLHLGYTLEATLQGAARDGGDVHIVRMFRDECRFLKLGKRYGLH
jgi:RimJ/RimL family protein N-acetyltransferase